MSLYPMSDPAYMGPFVDVTFSIVGSSDPTKTLKFEVDAQSTGADLTIDTGAQTADRTLTVPVLTGNATLAVLSEAQTFSGAKTFSAATTISNTTASDSTTTGALVVAGGAGVGGSLTLGNDGVGVSIRAPSFVLRSTLGGVSGNIYMDMGTGSVSHGEFIIRSSNGYNDRMTIDATGNLIVHAGQLQIRTTSTPASAAASGVAGTISWDSNYIYVCVAANTWKRVAIATWP